MKNLNLLLLLLVTLSTSLINAQQFIKNYDTNYLAFFSENENNYPIHSIALTIVVTDIEIECSEDTPPPSATVQSSCENAFWTVIEDVEYICENYFVITRTYYAFDDCENFATATQTIDVSDTTPPLIYMLTYSDTPILTDNCTSSENIQLDISHNNDQSIITYTATDLCGNASTISFNICNPNVNELELTTNSMDIFNIPDPNYINCETPTDYNVVVDEMINLLLAFNPINDINFYINKLDELDYTNTFKSYISEDEYTSPIKKRGGAFTWNYYQADEVFVGYNDIAVVSDLLPVVLKNPIECGTSLPCPFENENLCNQYQATYSEILLDGNACNGIFLAIWNFTNENQEVVEYKQIYKKIDTEPPYFTYIGPDITVSSYDEIPINDFEFTDNCDDMIYLDVEDYSFGDNCCENYVTRTITLTDNCGNVSTITQEYTIIDTEAPVFTYIGPNMTVDSYADIPVNDFEVSDNCGNVNFYIDEWGYIEDGIQYVIRGTFSTDDCGNSSFAEQFYTIFNPNEVITIQAKVILQGPYTESTQLMTDYLRTGAYLPTSTPMELYVGCFGCGGCGAGTNQSVLDITGGNAIVDWIFIEVYENYPFGNKGRKCALLQRDGDIVAADGISPVTINGVDADNVTVVITHRNHFGVRSLNSYPTNQPIVVDFTDPNTNVFGTDPMVQIGNKMVMVAGDANRDGQVNAVDKNEYWRVQNGTTYDYEYWFWGNADFNLDGSINAVDKNGYWRINNSMIEQLD